MHISRLPLINTQTLNAKITEASRDTIKNHVYTIFKNVGVHYIGDRNIAQLSELCRSSSSAEAHILAEMFSKIYVDTFRFNEIFSLNFVADMYRQVFSEMRQRIIDVAQIADASLNDTHALVVVLAHNILKIGSWSDTAKKIARNILISYCNPHTESCIRFTAKYIDTQFCDELMSLIAPSNKHDTVQNIYVSGKGYDTHIQQFIDFCCGPYATPVAIDISYLGVLVSSLPNCRLVDTFIVETLNTHLLTDISVSLIPDNVKDIYSRNTSCKTLVNKPTMDKILQAILERKNIGYNKHLLCDWAAKYRDLFDSDDADVIYVEICNIADVDPEIPVTMSEVRTAINEYDDIMDEIILLMNWHEQYTPLFRALYPGYSNNSVDTPDADTMCFLFREYRDNEY